MLLLEWTEFADIVSLASPTLVATAAGDQVRKGRILAVLASPTLRNEYERQLAIRRSMNAGLAEECVKLNEDLLTHLQEANLDVLCINTTARTVARA